MNLPPPLKEPSGTRLRYDHDGYDVVEQSVTDIKELRALIKMR